MKLTEGNIQDALYWPLHRKGCHYICPNFTPIQWWECDMFAITKAGYWVEYEIKISKADFKNDRHKAQTSLVHNPDKVGKHEWDKWDEVHSKKHELLSLSSDRGPSRFVYVVRHGLITPSDVPEYAGLIEVTNGKYEAHLHEAKRAPILHRVPPSDKMMAQIKETFYWRYWRLRQGLKHATETVGEYSI